jgi:hypothetical protein
MNKENKNKNLRIKVQQEHGHAHVQSFKQKQIWYWHTYHNLLTDFISSDFCVEINCQALANLLSSCHETDNKPC